MITTLLAICLLGAASTVAAFPESDVAELKVTVEVQIHPHGISKQH